MMLTVCYKPSFIRQFKKLPVGLQEEVIAKIELFKDSKRRTFLDVHKLHGSLKSYWAFSVDFQNRIIFEYISKSEVALLAIGDHDIYK